MTKTFTGVGDEKGNVEKYYELTSNKIVEHIGASALTYERSEIEKKEDSDSGFNNGYYLIKPQQISFSQHQIIYAIGSKTAITDSNRSFFINRKTGAWNVYETYKGSMANPSTSIKIDGNCEPWDSSTKF